MDEITQAIILDHDAACSPVRGRPSRQRWMSDEQMAAIRQVSHFCNSEYRALDLNTVVDEYVRDFVEPLLRLGSTCRTVADVGTGYGWLALAFALRTHVRVIAIEYDPARLAAARRIADILGVAHRIEWLEGSIAALRLPDRSVDAVYCVEVIEHTGVQANFIRELCRISNDVLVITTPNKLFPVIGHDTALPFCHWLPLRARDLYAAACGRSSQQENNMFWSPSKLLGSVTGFRRVSRFMQFESYADYRELHTGGNSLARRCLAAYLALAARLGRHAIHMLPNLASTFRRCQ